MRKLALPLALILPCLLTSQVNLGKSSSGCANPLVSTLISGVPQSYPTATNSSIPSTCYPNPFCAVGDGRESITRVIYSKAELQAIGIGTGDILGLSLYLVTAAISSFDSYEIRITNISSTSFDARAGTTQLADTVFISTSNTLSVGWNDFNFTKDFYWDGTSNIMVEFRIKNPSSSMAGGNVFRTLNVAPNNQVAYKYSNTLGVSADNDPMSWTGSGAAQTKPQIKFQYCNKSAAGLSNMTGGQFIELYPTITNDEIKIISHAQSKYDIQVVDMSGKKLLNAENIKTISLKDFSKGIYLVNIVMNETVKQFHVQKE